LGGLVILALLTFYITVKSWREAKRSPYFFLRVQAARKMQRYLLVSFLLIVTFVLVAGFAWQAPDPSTNQIARIVYAKPMEQDSLDAASSEVAASSSPVAVEINMGAAADRTIEATSELTDPLLKPSIPSEYDQIEPSVELSDSTDIGAISFSTDIDDRYQAVNPVQRVSEGFFTLYATFDYSEMANDMAWAWVWRHNGEVVDGGNQLWSYGDEGPGYVYFQPEEGFYPGRYTLEVWVNDSLMAQSSILVIESVSANN
jgi:hypothetical protein